MNKGVLDTDWRLQGVATITSNKLQSNSYYTYNMDNLYERFKNIIRQIFLLDTRTDRIDIPRVSSGINIDT